MQRNNILYLWGYGYIIPIGVLVVKEEEPGPLRTYKEKRPVRVFLREGTGDPGFISYWRNAPLLW